jgi:hypothetical protein
MHAADYFNATKITLVELNNPRELLALNPSKIDHNPWLIVIYSNQDFMAGIHSDFFHGLLDTGPNLLAEQVYLKRGRRRS